MEQFEGLKIFTLNCWGLRYFSKHRKLRIKLIAQHLSENDYDIAFLQEVWIQSDFEYIRSKTQHRYTFAHMFNNASILGTSGLVIMAKWNPKMIHFHPYSINGTPFRPHHGDWFSTKGVAYVRIEVKGFNLHLFCTHMHAQYDEEEDITDQYSIHRICQSYELAKYINLMACNCSNPSSRDLIVLAGDMNTSSKELPYRLLVELTGLSDCYKYERKKKLNSDSIRRIAGRNQIVDGQPSPSSSSSTNYGNSSSSSNSKMLSSKPHKSHISRLKYHTCSDESSDEELITCGHKENTFTGANPNPKSSKRIDFILYKLRDKLTSGDFFGDCSAAAFISDLYSSTTSSSTSSSSSAAHSSSAGANHAAAGAAVTPPSLSFACRPDPLKITAKDISGLSYSDHQPVAAHLKLVKVVELEVNNSSASSASSNSSSSSLKEVLAAGGDGGHSSSQLSETSEQTTATTTTPSSKLNKSHSHSHSHHHNNNNNSLTKNKQKSSSGGWTNLGKQSASTSSSQSSSHGRKQAVLLSPLLHDIEKLLSDFINASSLTKDVLLVALVLTLATASLAVIYYAFALTAIEAVLLGIILLIVCLFAFFLRFVTHRHEVNAVKAILNDITKKKSFATEYGLLAE